MRRAGRHTSFSSPRRGQHWLPAEKYFAFALGPGSTPVATIASNPGVPTAIQDVAKKIGDAAAELMEKTLRDFDTLEDPANFVICFAEEMDRAVEVNDTNSILSATALQRGLEQMRAEQGVGGILEQLGGNGNGQATQ